jgi:AraC-like DNA-binding protein
MLITRLRTADLPIADRFAAWSDFTSYAHRGVVLDSSHRQNFVATVDAHDFGTLQVSRMTNPSTRVRRSAAMVRSNGCDIVLVSLLHTGRLIVDRDGTQTVAEAGSLVVFDWARPMSVGNRDDCTSTILQLPISALGPSRAWLESIMGRPIASTGGIGGLLAYAMTDLLRHGDSYAPGVLTHLTSAVLDLLGTATRLANGGRETTSRIAPRRDQVYAYIEQALAEPTLTPAAIAAAQGLSLRQLNRILHEDGTSVASYVRQRRLDRCRQDLIDPAHAQLSVAIIGGRWGFPDPASFGRAFRHAFGMPPGEYRRRFSRP